jgi:hypothetical protein
MKYVLVLFSTLEMLATAGMLALSWRSSHFPLFVMLFALCGANLMLRLREETIEEQIAEAEEKIAKRVLRRLSKVMPSLLDEYFKAQAAKPEQKVLDSCIQIPDSLTDADHKAAALLAKP